MADRMDAESLARLLATLRLSDRELAALFDVNQSTVSRLRHAKTSKVERYTAILEQNGFMQFDALDGLESAVAGLAISARKTPALAKLLIILHETMQEITFDPVKARLPERR